MERRIEQRHDRDTDRAKADPRRRRERQHSGRELERHLEIVIDMATD
ncbi:MAG TPA: hypothetical protein VML75_22365 [Kofleriaceae bacterium]|nr:hypothetical protein [Kofleriaceae bacterium]